MDKAREIRRPWRSWTVIALVLAALALAQACGQSGNRTGPTTTSSSALQLKLRRVGAAELPPGCTGGTYSVTGPGVNIQDAPLGADGNISVPLTVGLTYTFSVKVNCPPLGILTGSTSITVPAGGAQGQIVINVSKVLGVACNPSTVGPGEVSTCSCEVQSLNGNNITWAGVNSFSGATATFSNQKPDTYNISCTINGIDTRSTTVTVKAPEPPPPVSTPPPPPATGTIQVVNTSCCTFYAKAFVQPADTQVGGEVVVTQPAPGFLSVPPGNYIVRIACSPGGQTGTSPSQGPQGVTAGNTTVFSFSGSSTCG